MWLLKTAYMWKKLYLGSFYMQCKNGKYLTSITDDYEIMTWRVMTCDEIIDADNFCDYAQTQNLSLRRR